MTKTKEIGRERERDGNETKRAATCPESRHVHGHAVRLIADSWSDFGQ